MHFFSVKFPYTICIQYELCLLISCYIPWDHNLSCLLQSSPSNCCRTHWPLASRTQGCSQIHCKGRQLSPEKDLRWIESGNRDESAPYISLPPSLPMRLLHHKTSPHRQADKDKFVQNQQSSSSRCLCTRSQVLWVLRHLKVMSPRHLMRSGCKLLRRWACSSLGSGREAGGGNSHKSRQTLWRNRIWCIAGKLGLKGSSTKKFSIA